jgi:hypothetical protein
MKRVLVLVGMTICFSTSSFSEILVLNDGTEMEVEVYAIKGRILVFTTMEGRARSVALSFVDLRATEERNRRAVPADREAAPSSEPDHITSRVPVVEKTLPADSAQEFQEVLDASGVKRILSEFPLLVSGGLAEARRHGKEKGLGASEFVQKVFEHAFRPDEIYEVVTATFANRSGDRQVAQVSAWLRSPLARRMAEMEQSARSPEGQRALREFAASLGQSMPPAARLEALQRLDELSGITRGALDRRMRVVRAALEAHRRVASEESRMTEQEMNQALQEARSKLEVSMKNYSLLNMLFTYRLASDEELAEYITFWEGESGRWLSSATRESLSAGIAHAVDTVMESIALEAQNVAWRR